jgi:hypothetical protein
MLNLVESNKYIIDLINKNEPFYISRLGIGSETTNSYKYVIEKKFDYSQTLNTNAGIYDKTQLDIEKYYKLYYNSVI